MFCCWGVPPPARRKARSMVGLRRNLPNRSRNSWGSLVSSASAVLTIWLCNGVSQFALVVGADALHEFRHCEHTSGFHNGPFPMHPLGLNGIEPGTLAR